MCHVITVCLTLLTPPSVMRQHCMQTHTHTHTPKPTYRKTGMTAACVPITEHTHTHTKNTLALPQTNSVPGVQSDSSEPEGTKTFVGGRIVTVSRQAQQLQKVCVVNPLLLHTRSSENTRHWKVMVCVCGECQGAVPTLGLGHHLGSAASA